MDLDLPAAASLAATEVLDRLGSSTGGLSTAEAAHRLVVNGPNILGSHQVRLTSVLFRQIRNPILLLLLGAALVSGLTGSAAPMP